MHRNWLLGSSLACELGGLVGWAARGLVSETNTGVKSTD
jgi:hypothetical protein